MLVSFQGGGSPGTLTTKDSKNDRKHKHKISEHKDLFRDRGDRERAPEHLRASDPQTMLGHAPAHHGHGGAIPVNPPTVPQQQFELMQLQQMQLEAQHTSPPHQQV